MIVTAYLLAIMRSNHSRKFSFTTLARAASLVLLGTGACMSLAQTAADDSGTPRPKDDSVRLGTITIVGQGDRLGAGQMLNEDAVKARSTITRQATEKDRATGNPYQALSLLPGVNTFNHDATGLFGGGMTIRGFSADQLGFSINGVPVNDSGNFAVYPQEYTDQENLCTQSVAQGNPDVESPHIGATGGSVGITSCDPEEKRRFRFAQTLGGLSLSRTFIRADTGRLADGKAKMFLSYSQTQANKWKGDGKAKKDHLDAAFSLDLSAENKILGSVLYNRAVNNNFLTMSLAQLNANGYFWDNSPSFFSTNTQAGHIAAVNGTAQVEASPFSTANSKPPYYALSVNPFENAVVSVSGSFKVAKDTYLKVQPYYWYGFGTGGTQQTVLSESRFLDPVAGTTNAKVDLNGDGDTLDTVTVARSSVTKTHRPGITAELNRTIGNHQLRFGVWYERAEHRQTQPAVPVDNAGNPTDIWLQTGQISRPSGSTYQGRDWLTISPAQQLYASDTISFMEDRGVLSLGVRAPRSTRNFTNFASEGTGSQTKYSFEKSFEEVLPQVGVRFNVDKSAQLFLNIGKNFRAPPNFAFSPTNANIKIVAGVPTMVTPIEAETSIASDLGMRLQTRSMSLSATLFNVDFKNRQANSTEPVTNLTTYVNSGSVRNRGLELELGTAPVGGWSAYLSLTSQKSEIMNDVTLRGQLIPLKGKQFALTPELMAGASLQYSAGPLYARLKLKHTGEQMATLMNDEMVPAYTTADFDAGYRLGDIGLMRNAQLRLNISNLSNEKYRNPSSGSVVNAKAVGTYGASTVFYYLGAPRLLSVTFSGDF
jgi:iron complex outermembrane receptor protein